MTVSRILGIFEQNAQMQSSSTHDSRLGIKRRNIKVEDLRSFKYLNEAQECTIIKKKCTYIYDSNYLNED